jgi:hypothetical protein
MYISRAELAALLKKPYFNSFLSRDVSNFALYRGHFNAKVLTLKYSVLAPDYTENAMITSVITEVMNYFPPRQKTIRGLIEYDVVLKANPTEEINESYYFWKANSNTHQGLQSETTLNFTYDSIFHFIRNAAKVNPNDLDLFFVNSNVSVDRITTIVFTFISV